VGYRAHKWLNVPYDCGIAIIADRAAHRGATAPAKVPFIPARDGDTRCGSDWTPELSRRARAVPLYAALRTLGRRGVADMIDRCCEHARRMATRLANADGIEIVNVVTLNQVLVRLGDDDAITAAVIDRVQREGTCWPSASTYRHARVMRISIVGWQTTTRDIDRSASAIIHAARTIMNTE
jgi:glutamate/tyrosine decarboxylase-like PLP-dependent enzyme